MWRSVVKVSSEQTKEDYGLEKVMSQLVKNEGKGTRTIQYPGTVKVSKVNKGARKTARVEIMMFLYLRVPPLKIMMDVRRINASESENSPITY